jgi:WD40 repeat protein
MKHASSISAFAAVSSSRLLSGGYDGAVGLFDTIRGRYVAHLAVHTDLVTCVAATETMGLSGGADRAVIVFRIAADMLAVESSIRFDDDIESVCIVAEDTVLVGLGSGEVHLVHLGADGATTTLLLDQEGTITSIETLRNGRAVIAGNNGTLTVLDLQGYAEPSVVYSSKLPLKNCIVLPDGVTVVVGGHDGRLVAVDVDHDTTVEVNRFALSVRGLAVTDDVLYVGSYDGTITRFSLPDFAPLGLAAVAANPGELWTRQMVAVGGDVYSGSMNGFPVALIEGRLRMTSNINCAAVTKGSDTNSAAVCGTDDGQIGIIGIADGLTLSSLSGVGECITSVAVSGSVVAYCTWTGGVFRNGQLLARLDQPLLGIDFVDDDLAVGTYAGELVRLDIDGEVTAVVAALPSSTKRVATHDGLLYVVGRYGPATIVDAETWTIAGTVDIETRVCDAIRVSPSGSSIAVAAGRNEVWVYDAQEFRDGGSVEPLSRLRGHTKPPKDVVWGDDSTVFTTGYDSTVRRYCLSSGNADSVSLAREAETGIAALVAVDADVVLAAAFNGLVAEVRFDG